MQEILLEDLPRHQHEYWVLEGMLPLGGGVIQRKVAIRPKLECDAIIRMELPDIFWADLGGWIAWHPKGTSSQASLLRARDVVLDQVQQEKIRRRRIYRRRKKRSEGFENCWSREHVSES